jgi:type I restriction enzyme M protein
MALTQELRRSIDAVRDYLYGDGFPDPLSNAEQLSYLFFFYLIEGMDADNALKARATKQAYTGIFETPWTIRNPLNAPARGRRRSRANGCAGAPGRAA